MKAVIQSQVAFGVSASLREKVLQSAQIQESAKGVSRQVAKSPRGECGAHTGLLRMPGRCPGAALVGLAPAQAFTFKALSPRPSPLLLGRKRAQGAWGVFGGGAEHCTRWRDGTTTGWPDGTTAGWPACLRAVCSPASLAPVLRRGFGAKLTAGHKGRGPIFCGPKHK